MNPKKASDPSIQLENLKAAVEGLAEYGKGAFLFESDDGGEKVALGIPKESEILSAKVTYFGESFEYAKEKVDEVKNETESSKAKTSFLDKLKEQKRLIALMDKKNLLEVGAEVRSFMDTFVERMREAPVDADEKEMRTFLDSIAKKKRRDEEMRSFMDTFAEKIREAADETDDKEDDKDDV